LRIVHQHKMLHLDIKPANIFITDDNKAVMIDFGAAREVLSKEGNFIRPMYTPGFAAPEMYRRDTSMGPWTDIYAIGACIYACMQGLSAQRRTAAFGKRPPFAGAVHACAACIPTT
jgi:serine/threonine protein kinase